MTLDEYVRAFGELSRSAELADELREQARHLYIGLALDLPGATLARQELLAEAQHVYLQDCGPNVPSTFEARLKEGLESLTVDGEPPEKCLGALVGLLRSTVCKLIDALDGGFETRDPFCRCACNEVNRSLGWDGSCFARYIGLDTFEKHVLFPGKAGDVGIKLENRRFFYSKPRIKQFVHEPGTFELERENRVLLGRPPINFEGRVVQSVVFLVPWKDAPHEKKHDATYIASRLGLPDYLRWKSSEARRNQGFAVLKFRPDAYDHLYRPTIVDALEHSAFRPGPADNGSGDLLRHGWTRVFKMGELAGDKAVIADELGCPEVVMPSRSERLPSEALTLAAVCFYES